MFLYMIDDKRSSNASLIIEMKKVFGGISEFGILNILKYFLLFQHVHVRKVSFDDLFVIIEHHNSPFLYFIVRLFSLFIGGCQKVPDYLKCSRIVEFVIFTININLLLGECFVFVQDDCYPDSRAVGSRDCSFVYSKVIQ